MTVLQLKEILSAELLCGGDHLDREVHTACGIAPELPSRMGSHST